MIRLPLSLRVVSLVLATALGGAFLGAIAASPAGAARSPYIVNGSAASISQWPYVVALLSRNVADPFDAQFCGGDIVAEDRILTAAHCVDHRPAASIDVLVGATRLEPGLGTRIEVDAINVHPGWDPDTNQNDLALLRLSESVDVTPIVVAPAGYDALWTPGTNVQSAGWGCVRVTATGGCAANGWQTQLRAVSMPLRDDSTCRFVFASLDAFFDPVTMRCAGLTSSSGAAGDSCEGDSGGPLRVVRPGLPPMLIGVVSWGVNCGHYPGAYTRLETYRTWLRNHGVPTPPAAFRGRGTPAVPVGYDEVFACDVNADGYGDVFFYGHGGAPDDLLLGSATGALRDGPPVNVGSDFTPVVGDFNGDGACDVVWYRPGDAVEAFWRGTVVGFVKVDAPVVVRDYRPTTGDFDSDGRDDIFWYGHAGARTIVWFGTDRGFRAGTPFDLPPGFVPVAGDFSGDGRADLYLDGPDAGADITLAAKNGGFITVSAPTQIPGSGPLFAGDFDGDGRTDLFRDLPPATTDELWRGATGARFERRSHPRQLGDHLGAVGRFDADDHSDLYWYAPGAATEVLWRGA